MPMYRGIEITAECSFFGATLGCFESVFLENSIKENATDKQGTI